MRAIVILGVVGLLWAVGCNKAPDNGAAQTTAVASESASVAKPKVEAGGYRLMAGGMITLASGEEVKVLSVGGFDQNLQQLDGLVAIEGRVKASYPERGALILVDCSNMAGCSDGCCPQAEVPVRLELKNYDGQLPQTDREIVIVGDLTVSDTGYELAVRQIRHHDEVLCELKTQAAAAKLCEPFLSLDSLNVTLAKAGA